MTDTPLPIIVCTGQSNMVKMVPKLIELCPGYHFLNAARGATSITQWQKGNDLFGNLIERTQQAIATGREVRALFVNQGEADTYSLERAAGWKNRFLTFVANFRTETGLTLLPVVYAQLGAPWGSPYIDVVKRAQAEMQANPTLHMVTLDDLPYADPPHYEDYEVVARRFIGIFLKCVH